MYKTYMKKLRNTLKDLEVYLNRGKYIFVLVQKKKIIKMFSCQVSI